MEQAELASRAEVSAQTVKRLERMDGPISANTGTEAAVRRALEAAGVIFLDENGEGPGVRLRRQRAGVYSVRELKGGGFVAVFTPDGYGPETPVSGFATEAEAEAWIAARQAEAG
jgi:transcriptional regulator with XRE-family HTH domain